MPRSRSPSPRRDYSRSRFVSLSCRLVPTRRLTLPSSSSRSLTPLDSDTIRITRLSKNVLAVHLEEIFDVYGKILDIDLPIIKRRESPCLTSLSSTR